MFRLPDDYFDEEPAPEPPPVRRTHGSMSYEEFDALPPDASSPLSAPRWRWIIETLKKYNLLADTDDGEA